MIGIKFCLTSFAKTPDKLIIPYTKDQVEVLAATVDDWAVLLCSFSNIIDNHFPKHPLLSFVDDNLVYFPKVTSPVPLVRAVTIFTDGSKTGKGAMVVGHRRLRFFLFNLIPPKQLNAWWYLKFSRNFQNPLICFQIPSTWLMRFPPLRWLPQFVRQAPSQISCYRFNTVFYKEAIPFLLAMLEHIPCFLALLLKAMSKLI